MIAFGGAASVTMPPTGAHPPKHSKSNKPTYRTQISFRNTRAAIAQPPHLQNCFPTNSHIGYFACMNKKLFPPPSAFILPKEDLELPSSHAAAPSRADY
jgi:hypothetical protein